MVGEQNAYKEKAKINWQRTKNTKVFVHHTENPQFFLNGNGEKNQWKI